MNSATELPANLGEAYRRYTLTTSIRNAKVACVLVAVLMPLGYLMDYFVYPVLSQYFLVLRLMSAALAMLLFILLRQPRLSDPVYRVLCTGWYLIPGFFICCMIKATEGISSTYYAGLNLVILAVSSVIQATLMESVVAVCAIFTMYVIACVWHQEFTGWSMVANNSFFMFCTAAIVITGNYFYNRLRFREFVLRFELDQSRSKLEESNRKLMELDEAKGRFFANISHELRTPLTLLIAPLETLINRFSRAFDQETKGLLVTMHANGMRLLKLINDLLDLVRLESGRMEVKREPMEMADFVRGLASAVGQVANDKPLTWKRKLTRNSRGCRRTGTNWKRLFSICCSMH